MALQGMQTCKGWWKRQAATLMSITIVACKSSLSLYQCPIAQVPHIQLPKPLDDYLMLFW